MIYLALEFKEKRQTFTKVEGLTFPNLDYMRDALGWRACSHIVLTNLDSILLYLFPFKHRHDINNVWNSHKFS